MYVLTFSIQKPLSLTLQDKVLSLVEKAYSRLVKKKCTEESEFDHSTLLSEALNDECRGRSLITIK